MVENPVIAIEGTKKGYFELRIGRGVDELSFAGRFAELASRAPGATLVDDAHAPVTVQRIVGGNRFEAFLEGRIVPKLLVPAPHVALKVNCLGRLGHRIVSDGA